MSCCVGKRKPEGVVELYCIWCFDCYSIQVYGFANGDVTQHPERYHLSTKRFTKSSHGVKADKLELVLFNQRITAAEKI